MRIIDLSVLLDENTPVYPGDLKTKIDPAAVIAKDGFTDHVITTGNHAGTHVDAPLHMVDGGKALDGFSVEQFVGRGRYIKVDTTFDIESVKAAGIEAGDIVLFHTGMSDSFFEPAYFENYPAMTEEVAQYLVDKKVKMVGLDTGSADNADGFPIHKALLSGGVLIIENLTNLSELAEVQFMVYALPLRVALDGSPARVIAVIE